MQTRSPRTNENCVPHKLPLNERVQACISADTDMDTLRKQGMKEGMRTLRLSGAQKVGAGLTTISEVLRVAPLSQG